MDSLRATIAPSTDKDHSSRLGGSFVRSTEFQTDAIDAMMTQETKLSRVVQTPSPAARRPLQFVILSAGGALVFMGLGAIVCSFVWINSQVFSPQCFGVGVACGLLLLVTGTLAILNVKRQRRSLRYATRLPSIVALLCAVSLVPVGAVVFNDALQQLSTNRHLPLTQSLEAEFLLSQAMVCLVICSSSSWPLLVTFIWSCESVRKPGTRRASQLDG